MCLWIFYHRPKDKMIAIIDREVFSGNEAVGLLNTLHSCQRFSSAGTRSNYHISYNHHFLCYWRKDIQAYKAINTITHNRGGAEVENDSPSSQKGSAKQL